MKLLIMRDAQRKLGLLWECDEIDHERAINDDFPVVDFAGDQVSGGPYRNLVIQGDNFDALRWLGMTYAGRVKLIYIDPPYNTGNRDWVYNDSFVKKDNRFRHSTWLEFMSRRLQLAKRLLAPDGAIFVSIDDNEGPYLKILLDQILGREMFVTSFIWRKVDSPNDNKVKVAPDHEYIHCYASDEAMAKWRRMAAGGILEAYRQVDECGRPCRDRLLRKNGKNALRKDRPTMFFGLDAPDGTEVFPIHDDGQEGCWAFGKSGIERLIEENRLIWKRVAATDGSERWVPYTREYAPSVPERPWPTIWSDVQTTRQAKAHHAEMFPGEEPFVTPKPEPLLARIMEIATMPGDIVVDFFLGSGTTAAVALKTGRRFIGVEAIEDIAGYTRRRLRKVVEGEQGGISDEAGWEGGGEFAFLRIDRIPFEDLAYDLTPRHVWTTVQAMHGLPLMPWRDGDTIRADIDSEGTAVVYLDRFDPATEAALHSLTSDRRAFVYCWTPGPVLDALKGRKEVEVRGVPDELVRRFRS